MVLAGELVFEADGRAQPASAGSVVHVPRGTAHTFSNVGSAPARMLFIYAPAGEERMFAEIGTPAAPGVAAPPPGPEDVAKLLAVADRYRFTVAPPAGE